MKELRWGVIGSGMISEWVITDLLYPNQTKYKHIIKSIGSSSREKGLKFLEQFKFENNNNNTNIPEIKTYDEVYSDPEVDLIYVGLPHSMHKESCIKALNNGKHVLCEKVFMMNSKDANEVYELAKTKNLFIMEGMWTKFNPLVLKIQDLLFNKEIIGNEIYRLFIDFSFDANLRNLNMESRMRNPKYGAGALLDVGVYMLTYARLFMKTKDLNGNSIKFKYESLQSIYEGIDYISSIIIKYDKDPITGVSPQCILTSSFYNNVKQPFARIEGSKGIIEIWGENRASPQKFKITFNDGKEINESLDHPGRGFYWEADAVAECIFNNQLECPLHTREENMLIMKILDDIRFKNGLLYPQDD